MYQELSIWRENGLKLVYLSSIHCIWYDIVSVIDMLQSIFVLLQRRLSLPECNLRNRSPFGNATRYLSSCTLGTIGHFVVLFGSTGMGWLSVRVQSVSNIRPCGVYIRQGRKTSRKQHTMVYSFLEPFKLSQRLAFANEANAV